MGREGRGLLLLQHRGACDWNGCIIYKAYDLLTLTSACIADLEIEHQFANCLYVQVELEWDGLAVGSKGSSLGVSPALLRHV